MAFSRKSARKSVAAAGVAIAAAASAAPANAAVVYSGVLNLTPTTGNPVILDLNPFGLDGTFTFGAFFDSKAGVTFNDFSRTFGSISDVIGFSRPPIFAEGFEIDTAITSSVTTGTNSLRTHISSEPSPIFDYSESGFIAFAIGQDFISGVRQVKQGGWLRFTSNPDQLTATLVDFAYETEVGASIFTGDVGSATVPLPATSLLLLSGLAGLAGVGARKRKLRSKAPADA